VLCLGTLRLSLTRILQLAVQPVLCHCATVNHLNKKNVQFVSTSSKGRNLTIESFDIVAKNGNKVERFFDIVAGVDGALRHRPVLCFR